MIKDTIISKYKSLPVEIEAIKFDGTYENAFSILQWSLGSVDFKTSPSGMVSSMYINTLEGKMEASPGDFIIKGTIGEFYPCKPEVFNKKYKLIESEMT